ncbi:MAG: IS1595 family transposase [Ignavibacteriales bacterium]|nr:IS1595 family transposase [Ignavibacteriales bacterium]
MNIVQVYKQFPSQNDCIAHLEKVRWHNKPVCPYCKSTKVSSYKQENRHHCNNCNTSFSVTVGTIFHKTKVDLQKWFVAISQVLNAKKGISARQLARDIEVNKDTAWYMAMRIRRAMNEYGDLLEGIIEVDETYIGGKPRKGTINNPDKTGKQNKRGRGTKKIPVVGLAQRGGRVHAKVIKGLNHKSLSRIIKGHIKPETSKVFTDEFKGYCKVAGFVEHKTVDHQKEYVNGEVHTNTVESFWALLKRGIVGQYHKISADHLPKYIHEFCYRHNHRKNDFVFDLTISRALGV